MQLKSKQIIALLHTYYMLYLCLYTIYWCMYVVYAWLLSNSLWLGTSGSYISFTYHRVWLSQPIKTAAQKYIGAVFAMCPACSNKPSNTCYVLKQKHKARWEETNENVWRGVILQQAETPWEDVWQKMSQAEKREEGETREERSTAHGKHMSCMKKKKKKTQ